MCSLCVRGECVFACDSDCLPPCCPEAAGATGEFGTCLLGPHSPLLLDLSHAARAPYHPELPPPVSCPAPPTAHIDRARGGI